MYSNAGTDLERWCGDGCGGVRLYVGICSGSWAGMGYVSTSMLDVAGGGVEGGCCICGAGAGGCSAGLWEGTCRLGPLVAGTTASSLIRSRTGRLIASI